MRHFNLRCKRTEVFPKSIVGQPPIRTREAFIYYQKTVPKQALKFFINDNCRKIADLYSSIENMMNLLSERLPSELFELLTQKAKERYTSTKLLEKRRFMEKYDRLAGNSSQYRTNNNIKSVRNISSKILTDDQMNVLEKGLNFNTGHCKKDILNLAAAVDNEIDCTNKIPTLEKPNIRLQVANALNIADTKKHSQFAKITFKEQQALIALKKDKDIQVVKGDKGNETVVIDKVEYKTKVTEHLNNTNTYSQIDDIPIKSLQRRVNYELMKLKNQHKISEDQYKFIRCNKEVVPKFYATIKTHKENLPIRPIVAFNDSPTYGLAKFLSDILMPLTDLAPQKLKNSYQIKDTLKDITVPPNFVLVSFDVKALFTSIPIDFAIGAIEEALELGYNSLNTSLGKEDIIKLTKICLESTVFQYDERLYKQIVGTLMGSPISVVIAEIVMQKIEKAILENSPYAINLWKRYVDDVLAIIPENNQDLILNYINSINPSIQFTLELERNQTLPYLDIEIVRLKDGILKFKIYRKPSHTGRLLNFNSSSHIAHKRSTIRSLVSRAFKICSEEYLENELTNIKEQLKNNGYPKKLVNREIHKYRIMNNNRNENSSNERIERKFISAPYILGASERLQRILRPFNLYLGNRSTNTIKNQLVKPKDKIKNIEKCNVVYKIECNDCNSEYIGETGRNLFTRLEEHRKDVSIGKENSQVFQHSRDTGHTFNFCETKVLQQNQNVWHRRRLESFYTLHHQNSINRAYDATPSLIPIVRKCKN